MAVSFSSNLAKASPAVPFLVDAKDLRGGFRVVADNVERDAMHVLSKSNGTVVFSIAEAAYYRWNADLATPAWENWDLSSQVTAGTGITKNSGTGALEADISHLDTLYAALVHNHEISEVNGLTTALSGKASTSHVHTIANVTGLQSELDGKALSGHSHVIGDVTGLQGALDGKASSAHNHSLDSLSNVNVSNIGDSELVKWDAATSKWINTTLAEAGIASATHVHNFSEIQNVPQVTSMPGVTVATTDPLSTDGVDGDLWFVIPA